MKPRWSGRIRVDAVLFDLDGTLIDSTDAYCTILNLALQRVGLPILSREQILEAVEDGGFVWERVLPLSTSARKEALVGEIRSALFEIYPRVFPGEVRIIEGVGEILKEIARSGAKLALVTSTPLNLLEPKMNPLRNAGLDRLLEVIITTDDVTRRKPSPDPLIECAGRLGGERSRMVYVGDTRTDLKAGRAAGMKTIGVLTGIDDFGRLMSENPDAILRSVVELPDVLTFKA
jgi:phosphoglycolate phosphatase